MNFPPWIILIGILHLGCEIESKFTDFKNTEFNITTGLYYEKHSPFQNIGGTMKLTVVLGKIKCENALKTFSKILENALNYCQKSAQFRCHERINYSRLKKQIDMASHMRDKFLEAVEEMKSESVITKEPEQNFRERRQLEDNLFSFDETMTEFTTEEQNLESNLTNWENNDQFIIRSELENYNRLEPQIVNEFDSLKEKLDNPTLNTSKELDEFMIYQKLNLLLSNSSLALEKSIEEYSKYLEAMIAVVHSMHQGKIHPYLIKKKQMFDAIKEIQNLKKDLEFPLASNHINVAEVIRMSTLIFKIEGDELKVTLNIPLLEKTKFHLYQLHSVHVPQKMLRSRKGRAYIKPSTKFLAMDDKKRYYFRVKENILRYCHKIAEKYICHLTRAYYKVDKAKSCELQLLVNSLDILKNCDIRVSFKQDPLWTAIASLRGWLYSLPDPELATIICEGETSKKVILQNTGILQLSTRCTLITKSVILPPLLFKESNFQYFYNSPSHLNISKISPSLAGYFSSQKDPSCPMNETDCSLLELEHQTVVTVTSNKKFEYSSILITFGCIFIIVIIFIILLCKICYCCRRRGMYKISETTVEDEDDASTDSEEFIRVELNGKSQNMNVEVESARECHQQVRTKYLPQRIKGETEIH